nr:MAG TPA: hypothetical protein [Caudoviricetes sp.]
MDKIFSYYRRWIFCFHWLNAFIVPFNIAKIFLYL